MSEPVHRTILLADIEKSGQGDDVVQQVRRDQMYETVQSALEAAGVRPADTRLEDRGDGVMALIQPHVPKTALLRALLTQLPPRLYDYNRLAAHSARVRLRMVLAAGEVTLHTVPGGVEGAVGWDLNQAYRLLDCDPLRRALAQREEGEDVALCVSDAVYQGVVRHEHHGIRRDAFRPFTAEGKEGQLRGWLYEPGRAGQDVSGGNTEAGAEPERRAPRPAHPSGGNPGPRPAHGGAYVAGDQYGVAGGTVNGDVVFGEVLGDGRRRGARP
ncbi:hypothetical protein [Streptomyces sp. 7-21]|uniref:hypothetical protein n=1 Tax=Streptomyces sp. 7-21 TaxID=2802283 RepID=UPI00191D5835|nr:hypothetical protein [Streptomyces sp. 7-21]MBL1067746.1 hypothetical protein [Streptomyces sp. 7-21]